MVDWVFAIKIFIYGLGGVFVILGVLMVAIKIFAFIFKPSKVIRENFIKKRDEPSPSVHKNHSFL
jgi:hypothetical protein